jgi:hypothetical protein
VTPEDLAQIRALVREELAFLVAAIQAAEERVQEFARGIESNLLHGYAESNQARLLRLEAAEAANAQRLAALEQRILNLETPADRHKEQPDA